MTINRRDAPKGNGKTDPSTAALPFFSSISPADAEKDANLFSFLKAFWPAYQDTQDGFEKWGAGKEKVEALPECPPIVLPVDDREAYERHTAFLAEHGIDTLHNAFLDANTRQAMAVKAVFSTRADTYQGVLAKLKIVEVAYGNGESGGDEELEVWQDHAAPWLENVIRDFERLAGDVSQTTNDDTCNIEELAALKFEPVGDPSEPLINLDDWLERAKQEYITMSLIMPIINSSDADFEQRIRDNDDPEGFCKTMQGLTENVGDWQKHYRSALEIMEGVEIRLMAVLARFVDGDDAKAEAASETFEKDALEAWGEDPFEALAAEWAEQKAECERVSNVFREASDRVSPAIPAYKNDENKAAALKIELLSDAATSRLLKIENRISSTPTTTLLGIATKLRVEASMEVEYEFSTTEKVITTALAGVEHLIAALDPAAVEQVSKAGVAS